MGARRLTNRAVAQKAGVGVMTVSKIRNGNPSVGYVTLKKVVEALGLSMAEVSEPKSSSVDGRFLTATLELVVRLTTSVESLESTVLSGSSSVVEHRLAKPFKAPLHF